MTQNSEKLKEIMDMISDEFKSLQEKVFTLSSVDKLLDNMTFEELIDLAIRSFTGSVTNPRNEELSNYFFALAYEKAKTKKEKLTFEFYQAYIQKLIAGQSNNPDLFSSANEKILNLLKEENEEDLPGVVYHSLAKEIYKVALNTLGHRHKKKKAQLLTQAEQLFKSAAQSKFPASFFYMGEMYQSGDMTGGTNLKEAVNCFKAGAALGDPRALFKLAQMYD